jgi:hypothetical protein
MHEAWFDGVKNIVNGVIESMCLRSSSSLRFVYNGFSWIANGSVHKDDDDDAAVTVYLITPRLGIQCLMRYTPGPTLLFQKIKSLLLWRKVRTSCNFPIDFSVNSP